MNIFSLKKESASSDVSELELLLSRDSFPAEDPILQEMMDSLLVECFRKKPDTGKSCSTKVWTFQNTPPGKEDSTMLTEALDATSIKEFQGVSTRLAGRYASLAGSHPGLLVFLNVRVTPAKGTGGTFFILFACDFEELNRYDSHVGQVEIVADAVNRKCRKAFVFPFFNGYELDREKVKVVSTGKLEGGIADLLYLAPPTETDQLLMEELYKVVTERHDPDQYERYFQAPPRERELFGDDSFVNGPDLLSQDEVEHLSRKSYQASLDKHGKKPKVRLLIDEGVKFEGQLDKMGETFFFAKKGDAKYLIVKGERFLTKSQLSSIEFLDVKELDDVISHLTSEVE
jgi:hypothetical protein